MNMIRALHDDALSTLDRLVTSTSARFLPAPSPCAEWNVRQLIEHTVGLNRGFTAALASGHAPVEAYASRPVTEWEDSVELLRGTVASVPLDRQVQVAVVDQDATFAAADVLAMHLLDLVVHGWDLAVSTGRDVAPSAHAVAILAVQAEFIALTDRQGPVAAQFGPARTAPPAAREPDWFDVLRLLGRDPAWAPRPPIGRARSRREGTVSRLPSAAASPGSAPPRCA